MTMRVYRRMSAGLSVWLVAACAVAQTTTITVNSRLVVLDVRVVDAKGKPVDNLDRSQFTVYEDKVQQRIRNFDAPAGHVSLLAPGKVTVDSTADLEKHPLPVVNILVIDELNTSFEDTARAQQAVQKFLEAQPEDLPVPMLFLASGAMKLTVLHDFTQSRAELLASLKSHRTDYDPRMLNNVSAGGSAITQDGFTKTLGALSMVASSVRGINGHKNVIWVGAGFDKAYDLTSASDSDADKIADALKLVTGRMMAARMSLSTIDPNGVDALAPDENIDAEALLSEGPNSVSDFAEDVSFDSLAESTGGVVVHGRNDLAKLVEEDSSAAGSYYTLSYQPSNGSDEAQAYRKIRVVMKDPNLHAITRTGYYEPAGAEAPVVPSQPKLQSREFKFDLLSAGASHMVYTGLHVHATAIAGGYNVQVEASNLSWKPQDDGTRTAEVSIVGFAADKNDKTLVQTANEYKERIGETDGVNNVRVGFKVMLDVPPNAARVRFVVRDAATGTLGSVELAGPMQPK
jgi:VWFA-related protein